MGAFRVGFNGNGLPAGLNPKEVAHVMRGLEGPLMNKMSASRPMGVA